MPITNLKFTNVGPFDEVEFEFDPQVNVFTGPNNSGKSTALWVLGEIVAYPFDFPLKLLKGETSKFEIGLSGGSKGKADPIQGELPIQRYWYGGSEVARAYGAILKSVEFSSFIPALRRSTDFRAEGPVVHPADHGGTPPILGGLPS